MDSAATLRTKYPNSENDLLMRESLIWKLSSGVWKNRSLLC
jgi:hypothetical protein